MLFRDPLDLASFRKKNSSAKSCLNCDLAELLYCANIATCIQPIFCMVRR